MEIDPGGIIVVVADHLPPLPKGAKDYDRQGYLGRWSRSRSEPDREVSMQECFLLMAADGQVLDLEGRLFHHFDLFGWILDRLSGGAYCRLKSCDFGKLPLQRKKYIPAYRALLGQASRGL